MGFAYVGHSYHAVTGSTAFFKDILTQHTELDEYLDDGWRGGKSVDPREIAAGGYERIFVFQIADIAVALANLMPERVVFVPMWDGCSSLKQEFWAGLGQIRVLSFSWALHRRLREWNLDSFHTQYFPDPDKFLKVSDFSGLRGYLWQRRKEIGWREVRKLSGDHRWGKFWLHIGMDPTYGECEPPSISEMQRFNIEITHFSPTPDAARANLCAANVFFASRMEEGVGMSFLEALARGQCVLAPDAPTMSEYITNGVNGILYDPNRFSEQSLSCAETMGSNARSYIEAGHEDWCFDKSERLPTLLFGHQSGLSVPRTRGQAEWRRPGLKREKHTQSKIKSDHNNTSVSKQLRVTVAIVTYNVGESFEETFRSIEEQTYPNVEIVVVDGGSNDNTLDLIRERNDRIYQWVSEKDQGPYDAMNKAAQIGTGDFIIYMNAGDKFYSRASLSRAMSSAPAGVDFIIGHHLYLTVRGVEEYHKASKFDESWRALKAGDFSFRWLSGIPCHQATLTRRALLIETGGYDLNYKIAADHEFMYRMRAGGAKFHHCGHILAIYAGGGLSATRTVECVQDWWRLARRFGEPSKADAFFRRNFPRKYELRPWTIGALWRRAMRPFEKLSKSLATQRRQRRQKRKVLRAARRAASLNA